MIKMYQQLRVEKIEAAQHPQDEFSLFSIGVGRSTDRLAGL
jgi:hypothetical protein